MDVHVLHTAYYWLLYPFVADGTALWSHRHKKHTRSVFVLQKRVVRFITCLIATNSGHERFVGLWFLTFYCSILEVILFSKRKNKVTAITNIQVHNHITRNRLDYHWLPHNLLQQ